MLNANRLKEKQNHRTGLKIPQRLDANGGCPAFLK
jgi:hypothetical protein